MALLILASSVALLLAQENLWVLVFLAIFGITVSMAYGPGYGLFQSLVGAEMRGTATAILFILIAVISAGLGPQFTGFFSDLWSQEAGQESLRYAMLAGSTVSLLTAVLFLAAMRHVRAGIVEEPRAET
jgi:MFS family permease